MRRVSGVFLLSLVISISFAALLQAQGTVLSLRKLNRSAAPELAVVPEDYGIQDYTYTVIPASDFRPFDSATGAIVDLGAGAFYRTGGGGPYFGHVITLPPGVILADVTTYISDTNATSDISVFLVVGWRATDSGLTPGYGYYATAHSTLAPGDSSIVIPWNGTLGARYDVSGTGVTDDVNWLVMVQLDAADNTNSFNGVRLRWKRQVSPAPGTARYTDVPTTHAFFQYVEALAAAGITSGCSASPPQFCPDAPVTRGQMAVFLAKALGLHWTP